MPKLEELAHATEETLVDVLGFPEQAGFSGALATVCPAVSGLHLLCFRGHQ